MAYDLLITDAQICDGTGAALFPGAVGVKDGVITDVGSVSGPATRTINADGCVVAPGFIDIHTHYDAQVSWDPLLTCSGWHGVTSVLMGQLRGRCCAVSSTGERHRLVGLGQCRGHAARGTAEWRGLG